MEKSEEFNELINSFYERNKIATDSKEEYIYGLRNRLGKFLAQFGDTQSEENKIIADCIKNDYLYYSQERLRAACRKFHQDLLNHLDMNHYNIDDCIFSVILNSDTSTFNSSHSMLSMYVEENELPNSLEFLFSEAIIFEQEGDKNPFAESPDNLVTQKESLKEKYKEKLEEKNFLVLIDDFTGSGDTISKFLKKIINYINPNINIIIFCIVGTNLAISNLNSALSELTIKYQISFSQTLDKHFEMQPDKREMISDFVKFDDPMGYKDTEVVFTTFKNTPNNTITLFWRNKPKKPMWLSLFPRKPKSGKRLQLSKNLTFYKKTLRWYLASQCQIVDEREKLRLTVLFYIKNHRNQNHIKTGIELEKWICYTDGVIWECQDQGFVTQHQSQFVLTDKGDRYLQDNKLAGVSIREIIEKYDTDALKKQKGVSVLIGESLI